MKAETVEKEFDSMKKKVEFILDLDPKSRDSDMRLFSKLLEELTPFRIVNIERIMAKVKAYPVFITLDTEKNIKTLRDIIEFHLLETPSLNIIPNFETIRRVRQKIQNEDEKYLPTTEVVARKRRLREELIREYYIKNKIKEE